MNARDGAAGVGPEVLRAASLGDRHALARLLAAAQPDIRRFARRTCRTSSDVDDAVQEAFWLLARRVGTLRAIGSFSAWLFAIVRRECLRLARRLHLGDSLDDHADDLIAQRPDAFRPTGKHVPRRHRSRSADPTHTSSPVSISLAAPRRLHWQLLVWGNDRSWPRAE